MKKKILFLICMVIIICMGTFCHAAVSLTDIKNTKYNDSVNMLISLGLVNGYEDNTYRPANIVTRAEMAKLMVIALGEGSNVSSYASMETKFSDMKKDNWSYGYVNLASKLGIINGYPDGTFGPNNTVSYAEATAMVLRALEYENAVNQSNEVWPANYINQAKKLSLYDSISTVNANNGANRGDIAIILWNMLRTGICTITGETSDGFVYGEGTPMINRYFTDYTYLENATINDVEIDDDLKTATIKIKKDKTISISMDAYEASNMYGHSYDILYNSKTKDIDYSKKVSSYTVKKGDVTKVTSSKIYIDGASSNGYSLPDDDNILLYGIEDIDEAVTANVILSGSTVKYVVGYAPDKVYIGLVTDNGITVSKKDGIKVVNYKTSTAKSYAMADEDELPDEDDVILYYLNADEEVVILDSSNVSDSSTIGSATSTKIKIGDKTYKFSDTDYELIKVGDTSLKTMSVSDIEDEDDSADVISFGGITYYIIYIGGEDKAKEDLNTEMKTALNTLSTYIAKSTITTALKNETTYTQSTYASFQAAYNDAKSAIEAGKKTVNSTNLTKVKTAYEKIQTAYGGLKKISSITSTSTKETETENVTAKSKLRKLVNGETLVNGLKVTSISSSNYDATSYKAFSNALSAANTQLNKTNATATNLNAVYSDLEKAMKNLVTKAESEGRAEKVQALKDALANGAKIVNDKDSYTESTYKVFLSRYNEAKAINQTTETTENIVKATTNLNDAINALSKNIEDIKGKFSTLLLEAKDELEKENVYTTSSYSALEKAVENADKVIGSTDYNTLKTNYEALNKAIKGLEKIDDLIAKIEKEAEDYLLKEIQDLVKEKPTTVEGKEKKIEDLTKAIKLEKAAIESSKIKLNALIELAKTYSSEDNYEAEILPKINLAETTLNKSKVTSLELDEAYDALDEVI